MNTEQEEVPPTLTGKIVMPTSGITEQQIIDWFRARRAELSSKHGFEISTIGFATYRNGTDYYFTAGTAGVQFKTAQSLETVAAQLVKDTRDNARSLAAYKLKEAEELNKLADSLLSSA